MQADAQDVLLLLLRGLPRHLQPPEQQRAMAALACTCAALRDGVAARCAGQLDVCMTTGMKATITAFACWLSRHGHLLRSLELNLNNIDWGADVDQWHGAAASGRGGTSTLGKRRWQLKTPSDVAHDSNMRSAAQRAAQQELEQALRSAAPSLRLESLVGVGVSADMARQLPAATLRHLKLQSMVLQENHRATDGDWPVTSDTTWGDLALPSGHLTALTSFCAVDIGPQDIQTLGGLPAQLRQLTVLVRKDDDCVLGDWTSSRPPLRLGHVTGLEQLFLGATDRYYDTEPTFAILPDDELPPALQSLGAADALSVAPLAPLKGLRELQLMDCKVPAGQLAQLSTLTQLTGLTLVYNLAGDPQVEQASAAWPLLAALREVDLEHSCDPECCGLSDIPAAAAEHAAAAKGLTRLVVLGEERPVRRS